MVAAVGRLEAVAIPTILAMDVLAMNIDDQPRRTCQQEGVVIRVIGDLEDNSRLARLELGDPEFLQQPIIHVESLAPQV